MIEEKARVIAVDEGHAWVEIHPSQTACHACSAGKGCGVAVLAKAVGQRCHRLRVSTQIPVEIDDEVVIGIEERIFLRSAFVVYMMPLLTMLLGVLLGRWLFADQPGEAVNILLGGLGLLGGFLWLRIITRNEETAGRCQPTVLRHVDETLVRAGIFSP